MTREMSRRGVLSGLASTLALGATASTAAAQENSTSTATASGSGNESTESEAADLPGLEDVPTDAERIDQRTVLLSSSYDGEGTATLEFATTKTQGVTLSDSGAFVAGGTVATKTTILRPENNPQTVNMTVTEADGFAGVSVSTAHTLYAVPLETSEPVSLSPSNPNDMLALLTGAGVGPGVVAAGWALRERRRANGVVHVG